MKVIASLIYQVRVQILELEKGADRVLFGFLGLEFCIISLVFALSLVFIRGRKINISNRASSNRFATSFLVSEQ